MADNPYREMLTARAKLYGIRPAGPSFLHLELGTTHLLHAIDRYRTAWVLEKEGMPIPAGGMTEIPQQGADLMPRTAVCINVLSKEGAEYRVDTPGISSSWAFAVKAAKELKAAQFPGHVAPRFVCRMAQSENLLPFVLGEHCAPIAIPAARNGDGAWEIFGDDEIRRMGFTQTARRFQTINAQLKNVGKGTPLQGRIDERGKLTKQVFGSEGYLLMAGAGGKHICAACLPLGEAHDIVVDQTLYWKTITSETEAWFFVGMLNSRALTQAIMPFNPKGAFGERHIHALPYRLLPALDGSNDDHLRIAALAQQVAGITHGLIAADDYLNDPNRALTRRRSRLRAALAQAPQVKELESLCAAVLGTTGTESADETEDE
ncbi:MAG TPA: hypothetical protein VG651_14855 [Stellaceae bacterium]|nr:hypothetical protein [Stellaceae bacterium]